MDGKEGTMATDKQTGYLADLIATADVRYESKLVAAQGRAKCDKLTAALMATASERVAAGLTVEAASALIEALESGKTGWTNLAKVLWGSEVKARVTDAIK
jgi:hypothetical protein